MVAIANLGQLDARVIVQAQTGAKAIVHPVAADRAVGRGELGAGRRLHRVAATASRFPTTGYELLVQSDSDAPIVAQTLSRFDGESDSTLGATQLDGLDAAGAALGDRAHRCACGQRSTSIALSRSRLAGRARVAVAIVHGGMVDRPAELQS